MGSESSMKNIVIIAINDEGIQLGLRVIDLFDGSVLVLPGPSKISRDVPHVKAVDDIRDERLVRVLGADLAKLTKDLFTRYDGIVMIMALGIVSRMIGPHVESKYNDPAVVAVDSSGQYSISVLSGHEGGANLLAINVASAIGAEPVITTASESKRMLSIGIGCRKGVSKEQVGDAVSKAMAEIEKEMDDVRWLSTIDIKREETALTEYASDLGLPLRYFNKKDIENLQIPYQRRETVMKNVGVYGVSVPCAILASSGGELLLDRQVIGDVTIAIATRKSRDS